ncbi:hypothetical protein R0K05_25000, partial [Planococcus sp. SIMBA_160]
KWRVRKIYVMLFSGSDSPLAGNWIKKQTHLDRLYTMKSLSRLEPGVKRSSKKGDFPGFLRKRNPQQGRDS